MIKRVVEVARAPFRERGKRASARQTRGSRFAAERRNPNSANHGQAIRTDQGFSRQKAAKNRRAAATDNAVLAYSVAATLRQPRSYQSVVTGHCNKPAPARNPQLFRASRIAATNCNKPAPARNPQPNPSESAVDENCNKPAPARNPQRKVIRFESVTYCNKPAPARNPQRRFGLFGGGFDCNKPAPARNPQHPRFVIRRGKIVINLRLPAIHNGVKVLEAESKIVINLRLPAIHNARRRAQSKIIIVINLRLPAIHNNAVFGIAAAPIITNPNLSAIYTQIDSDGCLF